VDNMEIYYIILGIIFLFVFLGWFAFESKIAFKAMDLMKESDIDKSKK